MQIQRIVTGPALAALFLACGGSGRDPGSTARVDASPHPSVWAQVSAGFDHMVGVDSDGALWAWGLDVFGQLGDAAAPSWPVPATLQNAPGQIGTGYAFVSAGGRHTAALTTDGTLWAWGDNTYGQVGDGTTLERNAPVQIGSGYVSVAAGGFHTVAVKTDGTLWAWGDNVFGQLGDGTTAQRNAPVEIGSGYASVAAGFIHSVAPLAGGDAVGLGRQQRWPDWRRDDDAAGRAGPDRRRLRVGCRRLTHCGSQGGRYAVGVGG